MSIEFLIIVNYYDADISWTSQLKWPYIIYYKNSPDKEPYNAINKGKSETNLLKYISDFYDNLPNNLVVVHQYQYKWYHDGDLVNILNDPNLASRFYNSKSPGFLGLNSFLLGYVDKQIPYMLGSGWWPNCMEPYFGDIYKYYDFTRNKSGGSQFIVSAENIRRLPKKFYQNMYDWMIANILDEPDIGHDNWGNRLSRPTDCLSNSNYYMSRYLEWTWELIFTSVSPNYQPKVIFNISALYGAGNYYRVVTVPLIKKCLIDGGLFIDEQLNFNSLFNDHLCDVPKMLILKHGDKIYQITEKHESIKIEF